MFSMQEMFKPEDGYHIVELHCGDDHFRKALIEAMKIKGYSVYGFSDRGNSIQLNFVTDEFAEQLRERHLESCRNSLGGAIDPQVISRLFRVGEPPAKAVIVELNAETGGVFVDHHANIGMKVE
jgi:hypothetical protein